MTRGERHAKLERAPRWIKGKEPICKRCKEPLIIGQMVVYKTSGRRNRSAVRRYHEECWEAMFH